MAPPPPVEIPERHVRLSQAIRDRLSTDAGVFELLEAFPWWKSIDFVDADLDGTPETVRIEWVSGEILVAHLKDQ
jgi:hypothetical protein